MRYSLGPVNRLGLLLDKEICFRNMLDRNSHDAGLNLRLCKGIYVESPAIAYKKYHEINAHYLEDLEFMFRNGIYPGIATHDKPLIA
ncbi:MAG: hypothetical protein ACNA7H_13240, partial [Desulfotignum sp.]